MRKAGVIDELRALEPRDHVCWVVDADEAYDKAALACLDAGRRGGDKLFVFGPEATLPGLGVGPDVGRADPHVAFLGGGGLDPEVMFSMFQEQAALARREGFRAVRVIADMDWLRPGRPEADDVTSFESRLDEVVADIGATVVCAYRRTTRSGDELTGVLAVHPLTVGGADVDPGFRTWSWARGCWVVSGEVDFGQARTLAVALAAAATGVDELRLRLDRLRFVDLAGTRAFFDLARSRPDCRIRIEGAPTTLRRCWTLLDYGKIAPNVELVP